MKSTVLAFLVASCFSSTLLAADQYQVTGPIVELTDTKIVVEKGKEKERHEFIRNPETKGTDGLKVGAKVTVHYSMTATAVEMKK